MDELLALQTLERKKMHEKQLNNIHGKLNTIAKQKEILGNSKLDAAFLQSMSASGNALKKAQKDKKFTKVIIVQI